MTEKRKINCWEFMQCGRDAGGNNADQMGTCPAALDERYHGMNDGDNAGRYCWKVAGTFCGDKIQGTFVDKILSCRECPFYKDVCEQEGRFFLFTEPDYSFDK